MTQTLFESQILVADRLEGRPGAEASTLSNRQWRRPKPKHIRAGGQPFVSVAALAAERECEFDVSVADLIKGRFNMSTSVVRSTRTEVRHVLLALRRLSAETIRRMDGKASFTLTVPGLQAPSRVIETSAAMAEDCYFAQSVNSSGQIHANDGNAVFRRYYDPSTPVKMRCTDQMTIITVARDGFISIVAAHYGPPSRPIPGTEDCNSSDQHWWFNDRDFTGHAFIVADRDRESIVAESIRKLSPWTSLSRR